MAKKKKTTVNTSPLKKQEKLLMLHPELLGIGIRKVKFELLELHPEHACLIKSTYTTILNNIKLLRKTKLPFVMPELVPEINWETLNDKSIFLNKDILKLRWLQISVQVLIGNAKDYLPYWNEQSKVNSEKLYLPTETDCVVSPLNSMNTSSSCVESELQSLTMNSQFLPTLNSQTISFQSSKSTPPVLWVDDDIQKYNMIQLTLHPNSFDTLEIQDILDKKWNIQENERLKTQQRNKQKNKQSSKEPNGVLKIRILPTAFQIQCFKRWLGSYNRTWNTCLNAVETENKNPSFISLKDTYTTLFPTENLGQPNPNVPLYMVFTPSKIRQSAVKDLCTAYESAKTNKRRGNISQYKIKQKKKKNQTRCFSFPIPKDGLCFYTNQCKFCQLCNECISFKYPQDQCKKCNLCDTCSQYKFMNSKHPMSKSNFCKDTISYIKSNIGDRKTHITICPDIMKDIFKHEQKQGAVKNYKIQNMNYKNELELPCEIIQDYETFILQHGLCLTYIQLGLQQKYIEECGMYHWYNKLDEYYTHIEDLYTELALKYPPQKPENIQLPYQYKQEQKPISEFNSYIRFYHRKNDKLLYNLTIEHDCTIKYEYGLWYMIIPYSKDKIQRNKNEKAKVAGVDPGIGSFLGLYSEICHGKIQQTTRFKKIRKRIDYYNQQYYGKKKNRIWISNPKQISYRHFKSKTNRLYRKQQNICMQLHYDVINFLMSNFNYILLPKFETQGMVKRKGILSKESKRELSQLQHYRFKQRLLSASHGVSNCKVLIVSEAYSTRECDNCGFLNKKLKLKERTFTCKKCNHKADRDIHAGRNIYLRNIQE